MTVSRSFGILCITLLMGGIFIWLLGLYSGLVTKEENVVSSWAQVEGTYQRRAELIPPLLQITGTIPALKKPSDALLKDSVIAHEAMQDAVSHLADADYLERLDQTQRVLTKDIQNIMDRVDTHSMLHSSDKFSEVKTQMTIIENQIGDARKVFNDSVAVYNAAIDTMPARFVAKMNNFKRKAYFKSDTGSDKIEKIDFEIQD